ncbi:MAG: pyridoxal phosphate-dependent aminotransferase [Oscillospiraceae bacterium]|nr:pyridoxal phosphate-dependent aminotransferase [Oscillospiraceae bacterium]
MKPLSTATIEVTNSPIREMFNLALVMDDVVSFTVGEPDFLTPSHVVDAAVKALQNGEHRYTPNAGILPLRQAICKNYEKNQGVAYDPEKEVIVTAGGMEALFLAMRVLLDPGDEILLPDPCWTNYSRQLLLCNAKPAFVPVSAENDFQFTPEALEAAITPKTKAFLINSPANPTGGIAAEEQIKKLAEIAIKHDLYVISDEVYSQLVFDGGKATSIATLPGMRERTIIIHSFSKTYAMTGWRVGYAIGPNEVIRNMIKFQENVAACVNSAAQFGAIAALESGQECVSMMRESYERRRALITSEFETVPGLKCHYPKGAFYAMIDVSATGMTGKEFALDLLDKNHVIVVPGNAFGEAGKNYVRISFATSDENIVKGVGRIRDYMIARQG